MDKKAMAQNRAGLSFFMAICQAVISLSPLPLHILRLPQHSLENRLQLFSLEREQR